MSPEAQRIAIAEACGLKGFKYDPLLNEVVRHSGKPNIADICPDYLNDLNAMHEAEKLVNKYIFGTKLATIVLKCNNEFTDLSTDRDDLPYMFQKISHASAAQRAEAFLRTLNLWDDTK